MTDDKEASRRYQRAYYLKNRERLLARHKGRYAAEPDKWRAYRKGYAQNLWTQVFDAYGHRCNCCGEADDRFLTIDHVNGGGKAHRDAVGGTIMVLRQIIQDGFPADYQILCFNCNLGRQRAGGTCPHQMQQ